MSGTTAKRFGWQWGMWAPGIFGLAMGLVLLGMLKDSPEAAGTDHTEKTVNI